MGLQRLYALGHNQKRIDKRLYDELLDLLPEMDWEAEIFNEASSGVDLSSNVALTQTTSAPIAPVPAPHASIPEGSSSTSSIPSSNVSPQATNTSISSVKTPEQVRAQYAGFRREFERHAISIKSELRTFADDRGVAHDMMKPIWEEWTQLYNQGRKAIMKLREGSPRVCNEQACYQAPQVLPTTKWFAMITAMEEDALMDVDTAPSSPVSASTKPSSQTVSKSLFSPGTSFNSQTTPATTVSPAIPTIFDGGKPTSPVIQTVASTPSPPSISQSAPQYGNTKASIDTLAAVTTFSSNWPRPGHKVRSASHCRVSVYFTFARNWTTPELWRSRLLYQGHTSPDAPKVFASRWASSSPVVISVTSEAPKAVSARPTSVANVVNVATEKAPEAKIDVDFEQLLNRVEERVHQLKDTVWKPTLCKVLTQCEGALKPEKEFCLSPAPVLDVIAQPDEISALIMEGKVESILKCDNPKAREFLVTELLLERLHPEDLFTKDDAGDCSKVNMISMGSPKLDNIIVDDRWVAHHLGMDVPLPQSLEAGESKALVCDIVKDVTERGLLKPLQTAFTRYTLSLSGEAFRQWRLAFGKGMFDAGIVFQDSPKQTDILDLHAEVTKNMELSPIEREFIHDVQAVLKKRYPHCWAKLCFETDVDSPGNYNLI